MHPNSIMEQDMSRLPATRRTFVCTICTICLFFAASTAWSKDIVLGMSAAFSGPSRGLGIELYRGSAAYFQHINENGGINGNTIRIRAYDDGYNPDPAVENSIQLVEKDNVFALFDYVGTPTVTRVLPLLKRYRQEDICLLFPFTGAQPQREFPYDQFVVNLRASYFQETKRLVDVFMRTGRERIAVFYQADAYGRSGWVGVKRALQKYNREIVGEATYRRGTPYADNLSRQVNILKQSRPDAIISVGSYSACAAFIRDVRKTGWNVPIANLSFMDMNNLFALLRKTEAVTGVNYTTNLIHSQVVPNYLDRSIPAVREYQAMMIKYDPRPPSHLIHEDYTFKTHSAISFEGFLNAKLFVEILRHVDGTPQRGDIKRTVNSVRTFDIGLNEPVVFTPGSNQGLDTIYFTTFEGDQIVSIRDWSVWEK